MEERLSVALTQLGGAERVHAPTTHSPSWVRAQTKKPQDFIPSKVKSAFTRAYKKRYEDSASSAGAAKALSKAKSKKKRKST